MSEKKDYTQMALDELLFEEKKIKKNQMYAALGSGFLYTYLSLELIVPSLFNSS